MKPIGNHFSPFGYPEIQDLLNKLLDSLFEESGRGAILIAATHVEEHLTKLIETALPTDISKKNKDRLFSYPGPLSSFAAKINLSYAFRIIDIHLYNSLTALRTLRNDAAHSAASFSLYELNERMKHIYNFGPSVYNVIREQAISSMMKMKFDSLNLVFDEQGVPAEERKPYVEDILNKPGTMDTLERQAPHWELLIGLCFVCGLISYQKERIMYLAKKSSTWAGLISSINDDTDA